MTTPLRSRPSLSRRKWVYIGVAVLALLATLYALSGVVMAGSFAISNYRDAAHWRMVGRVYGILFYLLLAAFCVAVFAFVRVWRRERGQVALNEQGMQLRNAGDIAGAEAAYRAAIAAAPAWSAPVYNLGLLYKYECRWSESLEFNRQAAKLAPDDEASWWNLGIAATALSDWAEARRAWTACGIEIPSGDGPLACNWGRTPVRLNPDSDGEVVWANRLDPARAQIVNVPLPASGFYWGDIVLTDGAAEGERVVDGRAYPVFNALQLWQRSESRTFIVELATADEAAIAALERCAEERGGAAEDWGTCTSILCRDCSYGRPHEHPDAVSNPAHPHCGLAARDHAHASEIVAAWLATTPSADLIVWYEAPTVGA